MINREIVMRKLSHKEIAMRQLARNIAWSIETNLLPAIGKGIATPEKVALVSQLYITMNLLLRFNKRGRL